MRSSGSSASASTTWRTMGRPQRECNTFGVPERMRVPSPAARTTALKGRYCFMRAPFGLGGEGSNLDSGLQRTLCCRYTTPECSHRRDYDADNLDLNAASPEPPAFAAVVGVALAPYRRWEAGAPLLVASPAVMGSLIKKRRKRMRKKKHKKLLKKTRWQRRQQGK